MPSRAETGALGTNADAADVAQRLRVLGAVLHGVGLLGMLLLAVRLFMPTPERTVSASVSADGTLDRGLSELLRAPNDTLAVSFDGLPDARTRAVLRAVRGSGHALQLSAPKVPSALAVSAEQEWRANGGTRLQFVSGDSASQAVSDAAGLIDSLDIDAAGVRTRSGPVEGVVRLGRAAAVPLAASLPAEARILVVGTATWESRFLIAALEEAGWPVDAAVTLSPRVTITQGASSAPTRSRHAMVVVLPGAPASVTGALPAFVRAGGGLVIVGEAARIGALASLRAGAPGATLRGEAGAEASEEPRHGLDLVPVATLAEGAVALEMRDGRVAVAARRIGAGRVMQVGYDNSWLWRMGGDDESPVAHRRWWTALLSGIVPLRAPISRMVMAPEHDTLDAAPVAALARELGLPSVRASSTVTTPVTSVVASLDPRWLLALAVISLLASWTLRRWRGLA